MSIDTSIYKEINKQRIYQDHRPQDDAMSGDIKIVCSPATTTREATAEAFSREVEVSLQNTAGDIHYWYNGTLPVSVADTSVAGEASIADSATEVSLVNGVGVITVEGDAAAWLAGIAQVETATAAGACSTAGNATVTVTAAGMTGTPKAITVALALSDNAAAIAGKIRTALAADAAVAAMFVVGGATDKVVLTKKAKAANDATLNIAIAAGSTGITAAPTSADTTAGVAPETNTLTVSKNATVVVLTNVVDATSVETIV